MPSPRSSRSAGDRPASYSDDRAKLDAFRDKEAMRLEQSIFKQTKRKADAEREIARVEALGGRYLSVGQGLYPRALAELDDAPPDGPEPR